MLFVFTVTTQVLYIYTTICSDEKHEISVIINFVVTSRTRIFIPYPAPLIVYPSYYKSSTTLCLPLVFYKYTKIKTCINIESFWVFSMNKSMG